jgi:pimeloyl-ACP methyl ester carboxylesterase
MTFLHLLQRLFALLSLAVLAVGIYLVWSWWDRERTLERAGFEASNLRLYAGLVLLAVSALGRLPALWTLSRAGPPSTAARMRRTDGEDLSGPDGSVLHVESYGPAHAPALILTHGWGMNSALWWEAKLEFAERYRVVVWDLPGLGRSRLPADGRLEIERLARALKAVVDREQGRPAVLVGHSIGGMILQEFARLWPETLGRQIAGLVLENTTHTDPTRTTTLGSVLTPLEKPFFKPMMTLDKASSPLVRLMNLQSYMSGAGHLAMRLGGFGARPAAAQLDQATLLAASQSPKVQAEGNLAMMRWDGTGALARPSCPVLLFIGERDLVTRPRAGEAIAAENPGIETVRVPDAGHMGPIERAAVYHRHIEAFADRALTEGAARVDAAAPARERGPARGPGRAATPGRGRGVAYASGLNARIAPAGVSARSRPSTTAARRG